MRYFHALLPASMRLTETETIVVASPAYFDKLAEVFETTTKRTIANYFMWRSIMVASNFLTDQVRMRKIFYLSSISSGEGQPGQGGTSQWKECTTYTAATWVSMAMSSKHFWEFWWSFYAFFDCIYNFACFFRCFSQIVTCGWCVVCTKILQRQPS